MPDPKSEWDSLVLVTGVTLNSGGAYGTKAFTSVPDLQLGSVSQGLACFVNFSSLAGADCRTSADYKPNAPSITAKYFNGPLPESPLNHQGLRVVTLGPNNKT